MGRSSSSNEPVAFSDRARESVHDWRDLLLMKQHRIDVAPRLVIADGTLGFVEGGR